MAQIRIQEITRTQIQTGDIKVAIDRQCNKKIKRVISRDDQRFNMGNYDGSSIKTGYFFCFGQSLSGIGRRS